MLVEKLLPLMRFWGPTIGGVWHCGRGPLIPCWYSIFHPAWEHVLYWDCLDLEAHTDSVGWSLIFSGRSATCQGLSLLPEGVSAGHIQVGILNLRSAFHRHKTWGFSLFNSQMARLGKIWNQRTLQYVFLKILLVSWSWSYHVTKFADPALAGYPTAWGSYAPWPIELPAGERWNVKTHEAQRI